MGRTSSRQGGTESFKYGVLKRPLQEVNIFTLSESGGLDTPGEMTARLNLEGISPNLSIVIAVGLCGQNNRDQPLYPPLPGVCKVTPYTKTTSGQVLYQKPLNLTPQTLPAAYVLAPGYRTGDDGANPVFGAAMADGALIEVTVNGDDYATLGNTGNILCAVTAHYTGPWWDIDAIENLLGYLNLSNSDPIYIKTGNV